MGIIILCNREVEGATFNNEGQSVIITDDAERINELGDAVACVMFGENDE